jgi:hypothetical protein
VGGDQLVMFDIYNVRHFRSEKERKHLQAVLIADTFSLGKHFLTKKFTSWCEQAAYSFDSSMFVICHTSAVSIDSLSLP